MLPEPFRPVKAVRWSFMLTRPPVFGYNVMK